MDQRACCTCAMLLSQVPRFDTSPSSSSSSEKQRPLPDNRQLDCCPRVICGNCIHKNPRFNNYCPYCQTTIPSSSSQAAIFPPGGLKNPPSYHSSVHSSPQPPRTIPSTTDEPPPYTTTSPTPPNDTLPPAYDHSNTSHPSEKQPQPSPINHPQDDQLEPILHFLNHDHDTIQSLSLRYNVPAPLLRQTNRLTSDHLLLARRTILIPTTSHPAAAVSLSPRPIEGEEEETRKAKIRRWMIACKVADYDVAVLYLEQAGYDLDQATEAFFADEAWEREHPMLPPDQEQQGGGRVKSKMRLFPRPGPELGGGGGGALAK